MRWKILCLPNLQKKPGIIRPPLPAATLFPSKPSSFVENSITDEPTIDFCFFNQPAFLQG